VEIQSLINELEALLQRSYRVPASGKLLVDDAAIRQILTRLRTIVPDEVRLGQRIASEREHILADARAQAHRMLEEAQAQVSNRLDEQGMVQAARERARSIVAEAEQRAAALQAQANQYSLSQLSSLENRLERVLREIQAGQRFLAQASGDAEPTKTRRQS
jgi:vacuolar-type H+-ATPase subunit H